VDNKSVAVDLAAIEYGLYWNTMLKFAAFFLLSFLSMAAILASGPGPFGSHALIYPPTLTEEDAYLRAVSTGARPVRAGGAGWIVVVVPELDDRDFAEKAYASGALAVVNPLAVGACDIGAKSLMQ
jgi:hypothetical protein